MKEEINYWIQKLNLIPHPEGGFYSETYRSELKTKSEKSLSTAIYFLLTSDNPSNFHRIKSDELWFHHAGSPLIVHYFDENEHHQHIVGSDLEKGFLPQFLVPKETIFGSSVLEKDSFSLVSCVVSPGFEFSDFELMKRKDLLAQFPNHAPIIEALTR